MQSHPLCKLLLQRITRCQQKYSILKFITTFTLCCVQGQVGEHISENFMQPTDSSITRALVFEIVPKGVFSFWE